MDAQRLLDSIYRGYPIGSLIFSEEQAPAQELSFGSISIPASARPDAWWIIDGQQRIASLIRTLLATHPNADDFSFYFDLDYQEFIPASTVTTQPADRSRWLPMAVSLDSEKLFRWLQGLQPSAERKAAALRIAKRFREYEIPAQIIHAGAESMSSMVFSRVNTTGRNLEKSEIPKKPHETRTEKQPSTIGNLSKALHDLNFGQVEDHILHRLLKAIADAGPRTQKYHAHTPSDEIKDPRNRAAATTAAREVIQFMKRDAGIPHYELLPCKQPFVTLGLFFYHHPTPLARSRELLARWLWRGALSGANSPYTMPSPREMEKMEKLTEEQAVQGMLGQVDGIYQAPVSEKEPFNFSTSASKLQTLALIDSAPRHLESGAPVAIPELFERTRKKGEAPCPAIIPPASEGPLQTIANRLVHPSRKDLRELLILCADVEVLRSHGVTPEARAALKYGDTAAFLELRARTLEEKFHRFFAYRTRREDTDRPSISSLAIGDED